jgi:tetratricopeptide (TPR) repeat protein
VFLLSFFDMNKQQLILIGSAVALFFILYFGCDTKTKEQKAITQSRALSIETLDIKAYAAETLEHLTDPTQKINIQSLTQKAEGNDPSVLKQLSAAWHDAGHDPIAAWYAEQIATTEKTDEAWSIAGANFYLALQKSKEDNIRDYCTQHAVDAFQNAVSLNPTKIEHKINLALCYTENPPKDNPMKGTLLLLDLEKQNAGNIPVNLQLARLGIRTGQYDKAIARLERILTAEPNNGKAICLLADAYTGANNPKAADMGKRCKDLMK